MKKLIGVMLALMIAVTGFAFAETTAQPVKTSEGYLLVCLEYGDQETLALIGSGDGIDAFNAFASDKVAYAERFEDFWKVMALLEPAVALNGSIENLSFESSLDNSMTMVTLNGVVVAQLEGLDSFAIVSGKELPVVKEGCDVRIWAEASVTGSVCPNCGEVDDGSDKHDDEISKFCDENHTKCMGDPIHHCDDCGRDYACSKSGSHTKCAVCGEPWCNKSEGDHVELECGHRGCEVYGEEDAHAKCEICGEYLCDGENHEHPEEQPDTEEGAGSETEGGSENGSDSETGDSGDEGAELPEGDVTVEGDASSAA